MRATLEPQADQVPGGISNRATRGASLGLAAVVLSLGAFSIFAAYATQVQVDRAQHARSLRDSYDSATSAIRAAETSELEYLLEASPEHRAGLSDANQVLISAVNAIAVRGGKSDVEFVEHLLALHGRYLAVSAQIAAAMAAGDRTEARRLDVEQADPIFLAMHGQLTAATRERAADAEAAFVALHDTARWTLIVAPVVFAIGFVLLLGLSRALERYHRATFETYREIEQLSRLRGEFVKTVSHEFRTPLTGIQGFSEMMRDEDLTTAQVREYAGDINKDALRLARLISDMLDLDRMESGQMKLAFEPVDLNRLLVDAAAQFRSSAADHPIQLHLDERLPKVIGNSERLTQVVTNLLSNAIKYSPNGGAVELRTKREERTVMLTIRDHGIGIPAEQLERIFERYARVRTSATRSIQGTGLGLAIVCEIVHLHEGEVWATSNAGDGAVFYVQLPLLESAILAHAT